MSTPKTVKFRRQQRGRRKGMSQDGTYIGFGDFGLQALAPGSVTARQIEADRVAINRHVQRGGKARIRIVPHQPVTKQPLEERMGKGKGPPEEWVAVVRPARSLYELEGVPADSAEEAMRLASHKLGIKTRFVTRHEELR